MGDSIANSIFLSDVTIEEMNNIISSLKVGLLDGMSLPHKW